MKRWIVLLCMLFALAEAHGPGSETFKRLEKIRPYAMTVGVGVTEIYVFVDPMCPRSRDYIAQISTSGKLKRSHKYFIFLYRLPRFDSDRLIRTVYEASDPRSMMQKVMIERCAPGDLKGENGAYADKVVRTIAEVAEALQISKRPSLIIFKPGNPYCIASEGAPDCADPAEKPRM